MHSVRLLIGTALLAFAVAACGGDSGVPKDAIATVNGTAIPRAQFTHWTAIAAKSDGGAAVPDAPAYTKCIAAKHAAEKAQKAKATTDAQAKAACAKSYTQYRTAALQQLTAVQWIEGEAAQRKVTVSDADVKTTFNQQKQQAYPKDADYQNFLKQSGETEADILLSVKLNLLGQKVSQQVTKGKDTVTADEVSKYYAAHKSQYAQPETRTLRAVINKSKAKAAAAATALKHGANFAAVVKQYSSDAASKKNKGEVGAVKKADLPPDLATPIFKASKNAIIGPITSGGSSYVFMVTKVAPASQQTLEQASAAIKQTLQSTKQQAAISAFSKDYEKRWRAKTQCADDFKISVCANGPAPTPTPTATATLG